MNTILTSAENSFQKSPYDNNTNPCVHEMAQKWHETVFLLNDSIENAIKVQIMSKPCIYFHINTVMCRSTYSFTIPPPWDFTSLSYFAVKNWWCFQILQWKTDGVSGLGQWSGGVRKYILQWNAGGIKDIWSDKCLAPGWGMVNL